MLQHPGASLYHLTVSLAVGFLWLALSAGILRGACAIFNRMARGDAVDRVVAVPPFGWAVIIQLVASAVSYGIYLGAVIGTRGMELPIPTALLPFASMGVSLAISLIVFTLTYTLMLPTTLPRAVMVCLLFLLISVILALLLAAMIVMPWFVLSRR